MKNKKETIFVKQNKIKKRSIQAQEKLTSADPHTEDVATVHVVNVVLLELTEQARAPTVMDSRSSRNRPAKVIVRVPVVEHPRTWRSAWLDEPPQETVWTIGDAEQMTPGTGAAEAHDSSLVASHMYGLSVQLVSLEGSPRMASVCDERCELMMVRERASESTLKA
jgi:ribosomal protein L24